MPNQKNYKINAIYYDVELYQVKITTVNCKHLRLKLLINLIMHR